MFKWVHIKECYKDSVYLYDDANIDKMYIRGFKTFVYFKF